MTVHLFTTYQILSLLVGWLAGWRMPSLRQKRINELMQLDNEPVEQTGGKGK